MEIDNLINLIKKSDATLANKVDNLSINELCELERSINTKIANLICEKGTKK